MIGYKDTSMGSNAVKQRDKVDTEDRDYKDYICTYATNPQRKKKKENCKGKLLSDFYFLFLLKFPFFF